MPAIKTSVKQYVIVCGAGVLVTGITPANNNRIFLQAQNVGANPAFMRWDNTIQLDGGDLILAAGAVFTYAEPCPIERLSFQSTLGTTIAIVEGTEYNG